MLGEAPKKSPSDFCSVLAWFAVTSLGCGKSFLDVKVNSLKIFFFNVEKDRYISQECSSFVI